MEPCIQVCATQLLVGLFSRANCSSTVLHSTELPHVLRVVSMFNTEHSPPVEMCAATMTATMSFFLAV
eukprot:17728-Heterococcus_DN1.PRE.2